MTLAEVFADVSYAPEVEGHRSAQVVVTTIAGQAAQRSSGRKAFITTSAAEWRLGENQESQIMGDAMVALLQAMRMEPGAAMHGDNKAAISLATLEGEAICAFAQPCQKS